MTRCPLAIVGAGPAGLSAAIAAAEAGVDALVIDENPRVGGQIYRQPSVVKPAASAEPGVAVQQADLFRRFEAFRHRVALRLGTTVWGLFPPNQLGLNGDGECALLQADNLILAPGAHEYVPPFPGWTLPGVMTPGAAQNLVKSMHVRPGNRVLIAGTGPFLLAVAETLHRAGTKVVGIAEMASRREAWRVLPGLLACPGMLWQGMGYVRRLRRAGVSFYRRHVLIEARGEDRVCQAVLAPCDASGNPDRTRHVIMDVDTVCVGYGFVPRTQLAQLAGCRFSHDDAEGGWLPETDENLQTSVSNIWVAGDGGGVAGAVVAQLEGALAGLAVARRLNALSEAAFAERKKPIICRLARLRRFRAALDWLYRLRPGLTALPAADTVVCRCEEVLRSEVDAALAAGAASFRSLKLMTRAGMGACQGLMCGPVLCRYLAERTGTSIEQVGQPSARPPIVPVALDGLAELDTDSSAPSATTGALK